MGMQGLIIVGAGAAGTGPLIWAAQNGTLGAWLEKGITVIERSCTIGGDIGKYLVNADSLGTSFIECLDAPAARALLASAVEHPATRLLQQTRDKYPTLVLVGRYLCALGAALEELITRHPGGSFLPNTTARALHLCRDHTIAVELAAGERLLARTVVMATGGRQDLAELRAREIGFGVHFADIAPEKILPSDKLLTEAGIAAAGALLALAPQPRVLIIGGSHSAFSSAWALLNKLPDPPFGAGDIVILHRRAPCVFYPSREAAAADSYPFTERDICPATNRVHRLGGLRNDGRELWRRMTGRSGTEPRARMVSMNDAALTRTELRRLLEEAALIVPALGYRFNTLPVFDPNGRLLPLLADAGGPAVNRMSQLRLLHGGALPNLFAVGLGSGYRPWGRMAGEPSFDGQQNSLWLYQNGLGELIYDGVTDWLGRTVPGFTLCPVPAELPPAAQMPALAGGG